MPYHHLLIEKFDGIAVVTLNRPERQNTLSIDLMEEIEKLADALRADIETRAVVFTGAGKYFSLGADVLDPRQQEASSGPVLKRQRALSLGPRMIRKLTEIPQITIAAINGTALGGAVCIASALDFRLGADNCRCGLPENNLGMNLSWMSLPLMVHLMGPARAKQFIILSKNENAATLREWGWLDEVVPAAELMTRAVEMAREYAGRAPIAAQMVKKSVNAVVQAMDPSFLHMDTDQFILTSMTEDFKEGITALMERRKPAFKGE